MINDLRRQSSQRSSRRSSEPPGRKASSNQIQMMRSPDSHPSDCEDKLSSSDEAQKVPQAINESQLFKQSFKEPVEKFEKFDFSEFQQTNRSSGRSQQNRSFSLKA